MADRADTLDSNEENLDSRIDELLRRVAHVSAANLHSAETIELPGGAHALAPRPTSRNVPAPGSVVDGRYRVEGTLGEGAMGVVLSAHNLRTGREVALKYMLGDEQVPYAQRCARVERFVREAQAVGRVRDPHVVDIYDVGGDLDAPYLVMERLHGQSLRERMRAGPLAENEVVRLTIEAARGVSAAHRQGVIHRDLKPDNLFLSESADGFSAVKVLDFGVSRILDNTAVLATITRSGMIVGTPAYMPLEQLRGEHEIDARADVYALGAIMYEALSGKLPFEGRTLHDLVLLMASDRPTPLNEVAPAVSPWLCSVVMRCLARNPDHRFSDCQALMRALEARVSVPSLSPSMAAPAPAPEEKRRLWLPLLVLLVVAAVGLFVALRPRSETEHVAPDLPKPAPAQVHPPAVQAEPVKPTLEPVIAAPIDDPEPSTPSPAEAEPKPPSEPDRAATKAPGTRPERKNPARRARDLRPEDF